jgi:hypothetical protein
LVLVQLPEHIYTIAHALVLASILAKNFSCKIGGPTQCLETAYWLALGWVRSRITREIFEIGFPKTDSGAIHKNTWWGYLQKHIVDYALPSQKLGAGFAQY